MTLYQACLTCGRATITWTERRRQFSRAIGHGLTPVAAAKLMPRCSKCLSVELRKLRGLSMPTKIPGDRQ